MVGNRLGVQQREYFLGTGKCAATRVLVTTHGLSAGFQRCGKYAPDAWTSDRLGPGGNSQRLFHVVSVEVPVRLLRQHPGGGRRITDFSGRKSSRPRPTTESWTLVQLDEREADEAGELSGHACQPAERLDRTTARQGGLQFSEVRREISEQYRGFAVLGSCGVAKGTHVPVVQTCSADTLPHEAIMKGTATQLGKIRDRRIVPNSG